MSLFSYYQHTPLLPSLSMAIVDDKRLPNAQAELRGLMISRRAAVSSSLWLGGFLLIFPPI